MAKKIKHEKYLPIDNVFSPKEPLYRRIHPDHVVDDELQPQAIELPDMSVNRGKLSKPEDALDRPGWGVASFLVRDIPPSIIHYRGINDYTFGVEHHP